MSSRSNSNNNHTTQVKDSDTIPGLQYLQGMETEEADLYTLNKIETEVQGVLAALQRISELLATNKKGPAVEDLHQKILKEYQKIQAYLNPPQNEANQQEQPENSRQSIGGIELEKNPLIKEMGGMPLEVISSEWQELADQKPLDKTELENLVSKKLKDRVELANRLKLKNKLKQAPKAPGPSPSLTPKYQKIQNTLKYILKEMPAPPRPAPMPAPTHRFSIGKPRPGGG